jgi:hypothetical protein
MCRNTTILVVQHDALKPWPVSAAQHDRRESMTKMSLRLLVFSLVSFLCNAGFGQGLPRLSQGKLVGDVADKAENAPIPKAFVLIHPDFQDQKDVIIKVVDSRFQLSLAPGLYDVFVASSGFAPSCKKIKVSEGHTTAFKPRLEPDSEHMEQIQRPK